MTFLNIILTLLFACFLTGCAPTGYELSFQQSVSESKKIDLILHKEGDNVKIIQTPHLQARVRDMMAKGYVVIGVSNFNGGYENQDTIRKQAIEVGATMVVTTYEFSHNKHYSSFRESPYSSETTLTEMMVNDNNKKVLKTKGVVTTHEIKTQRRYNQTGVFMAKTTNIPPLGLIIADLPEEHQSHLKLRKGVIVNIVITKSPAYHAYIEPGDIIISIDGVQIIGRIDANKLIGQAQNKISTVELLVIRDGKTIKANLNPGDDQTRTL